MSDFNEFTKQQLARKGVAQEYYRLAPFYRMANELVLLRKKRSLTQQELADKAQTTQTVVSRLENVTVHCSLETIINLAEALDAVVDVHLTPKEELIQEEREEALSPEMIFSQLKARIKDPLLSESRDDYQQWLENAGVELPANGLKSVMLVSLPNEGEENND